MPGADDGTCAVVDASVAVTWLIEEPNSADATALLERPVAWVAPRLLFVDAAAALRRKVTGDEITTAVAVAALRVLADATCDGTIRLADDEFLSSDALLLAFDLQHKVPDCLYLALAERDGYALATTDARLGRLARSRGVAVLGIGTAAR